jgi:DNA-binding PadR family transcriptional regulator
MPRGIYIGDDGIYCGKRGRGWGATWGPKGFAIGGDQGWGDIFRAGRTLAAGDIRLIVLLLLAEKPRHGYDIIKEIEERTHGFYGPSPGVVYPTLTYLEEVGYATVETEGTKKRYAITAQGREHLAANRAEADAVLSQIARMGEKMAHIRRWFDYDETEHRSDPKSVLYEAREELREAVREKNRSSSEELARVIEILRRATKDIRGR